MLGAVSAVTSQGRTGDVKVFGWDLTKQAIEGIDDGWVTAVVQQDPAGEGKAAVEALIKLKKGEKVEPIINIPVTIVTKENVEPIPRDVQVDVLRDRSAAPLDATPRTHCKSRGSKMSSGETYRVRMSGHLKALQRHPDA